ncbi:hypothetical protein ANN_08818 [Periplaneta americana]|uniref:Transposase Tc1-like domain-containing protein n=1 Tax=Periplaneta americana TaxID=6978 RepID=A0ABQ8T4S0_PERAM|nr:hypothetical protein ANN_08818 [Periplaneta americana]
MGKKAVSEAVKWQIIGMHKSGRNQTCIAKSLGVSRHCVQNTLATFGKTQSVTEKLRTGRPRVTSSRVDKTIVKLAKKNRRLSAIDISGELKSNLNIEVSRRTVSRRLTSAGMLSRIATRKPLLTPQNRQARYDWCKDHLDWTVEKWSTVIFSDESSFQLFPSSPTRIRRQADEKYSPGCVAPRVQKGGGSVMVWGCFCAKGMGELAFVEGTVNSDTYIQLMQNYLLPSKRKLLGRRQIWLYQQDNAPVTLLGKPRHGSPRMVYPYCLGLLGVQI